MELWNPGVELMSREEMRHAPGLFMLLPISIVIGLAVAYAGGRLIETLLFGVSGRDPRAFAFAAAFLPVVAVLASYLPARRGVKVDPIAALRVE